MQTSSVRQPWAVFDRAGRVRRVCMGWEEHDAWRDFLAWASPERIDQAKRKGFRAVPVQITEQTIPEHCVMASNYQREIGL